jgi:hypothetical protein
MKKLTRIPLKLTRETLRQLDDERAPLVVGGRWPTQSALAGGCSVGGFTCTCECV